MTALAPALATLLGLVALAAAYFDWRERRVPNWLTLAGLIAGLAANVFLAHTAGLWTSLKGAGIALAIYLPLYLLRGVGGGDLKLMVAIGAIAGPRDWITIWLITALLGGFAALVVVALQHRLLQTLQNVGFILKSLAMGRVPYHENPQVDVRSAEAARMPHGVVIACAVLGYLLLTVYWRPPGG